MDRILLADDNVDFVNSIGALLTAMGHSVVITHNGTDALAAAMVPMHDTTLGPLAGDLTLRRWRSEDAAPFAALNADPAVMARFPRTRTATESEAEAGMKELIWYMQAKTEAQYRNPPGYAPVETNVQGLKGAFSGRTDAMRAQGLEFQRDQGVIIAGTPDSVVEQINRLYERLGGFDHLLVMLQSGFLDHARTVRNMTWTARSGLPKKSGTLCAAAWKLQS